MERHSPSNTTSLPTAPKGREADLGEERSGLGWTALRGRPWQQGGTIGAELGLPYRDEEEEASPDPAEGRRGGELRRSGAGSGGGGGGEGFRRGDERLGDGQGERSQGDRPAQVESCRPR
jgi:hypothetical protein